MAKAQMNGWPLNTHGSGYVSSSQTWCTDRARVNSVSGSTVKTLSITNFNVSGQLKTADGETENRIE